jgi:hypothetical protein
LLVKNKITASILFFLLIGLSLVSSIFSGFFLFNQTENSSITFIYDTLASNTFHYTTSFLFKEEEFSNERLDWDSYSREFEDNSDLKMNVSKYFGSDSLNKFSFANDSKLETLNFVVLDTKAYEKEPYFSNSHVYSQETNGWKSLEEDFSFYINRPFAMQIANIKGINYRDIINSEISVLGPDKNEYTFTIRGTFDASYSENKINEGAYLEDLFGPNVFYMSRKTASYFETNIYFSTFRSNSAKQFTSQYKKWSDFRNKYRFNEYFSSDQINGFIRSINLFYNNPWRFFWGVLLIIFSLISMASSLIVRFNCNIVLDADLLIRITKINVLHLTMYLFSLLIVLVFRFLFFPLGNGFVIPALFQGSMLMFFITIFLIFLLHHIFSYANEKFARQNLYYLVGDNKKKFMRFEIDI